MRRNFRTCFPFVQLAWKFWDWRATLLIGPPSFCENAISHGVINWSWTSPISSFSDKWYESVSSTYRRTLYGRKNSCICWVKPVENSTNDPTWPTVLQQLLSICLTGFWLDQQLFSPCLSVKSTQVWCFFSSLLLWGRQNPSQLFNLKLSFTFTACHLRQ